MFDPAAPWLSDPIVTPAQGSTTGGPGFTGVIPGAPKPTAPKDHYEPLTQSDPRYRPDFPNAQVDTTTNQVDYGPQVKVQDSDEAKKQAALDAARNTIQSIERARPLVSNWSTGLGGAVGKLYPGSDQAKQLDSIIHQELRGNIFQNWVAQLKAESTTGTSGIGRIMQSEIPLVTGALGTLDPVALGREGTLQSFDQIENRILRTVAQLNGENPDDPNVLAKYQKQFGANATGNDKKTPPAAPSGNNTPPAGPSAGGGGGSPGGGGDNPPGMSQLTPEQQAKDQAFLKTNPTPEQYTAFLSGLISKPVDPKAAADRLKAAETPGYAYSGAIDNSAAIRAEIDKENKLGLGDNPATTLALHGATLNLSDEAAGVGNAISNLITHPLDPHPVDAYTFGRDVERQRIEDARSALGYGAGPVEFLGSMGAAAPTSALAAIKDVPALVAQGAKGGALGGALAGYGAGNGVSQSLTGAAVGAGTGAAVGALAPYAAGKLAARSAPQGMAPDVAKAAQAEGVDLVRPMVDPASRGKFGALESAPGSQNIIRDAVANTRQQIEGRVADLGAGGTALEPGAAGERLQVASNRYIQRSRGIANRLYGAAENAAGDTKIVPQAAIDQADAIIKDLSANPNSNGAQIKFIQGIRDDLASPGGKTVADIRNIREGLRGQIGQQNLTMSSAEKNALDILNAAGQDISAANPEAGRLYRRADAFYRDRQAVVDDIKRSILGNRNDPLDPQKAYANIKTLAAPGGNLRRLSAVMRYLEPDERQDIAATVASTLGRDAPDGPFSSDKLISQTNKFSPAALRTIFGDGGAQSIANLRLLSQKLKEGVGDINRSKTANSMLRQMASRFVASITGLGGAAGMAAGGLHGGGEGAIAGLAVGGAVKGVGMARNILSARAMVNPRVSQWLAQAADVSTPSQARNAVKGLSLVISREPALASELSPIRDFLDQRVTQLLAAQPNDQQDQQRP